MMIWWWWYVGYDQHVVMIKMQHPIPQLTMPPSCQSWSSRSGFSCRCHRGQDHHHHHHHHHHRHHGRHKRSIIIKMSRMENNSPLGIIDFRVDWSKCQTCFVHHNFLPLSFVVQSYFSKDVILSFLSALHCQYNHAWRLSAFDLPLHNTHLITKIIKDPKKERKNKLTKLGRCDRTAELQTAELLKLLILLEE